MRLTEDQLSLLQSLSTDYKKGLQSSSSTSSTSSIEYNIIPAPFNCPKWACIILPCINHVPSMKLYKTIQPTEAEVRKKNKWVVYDAVSITKGDIIRLTDGDIVPADVIVLSLGMDFVHDGNENENRNGKEYTCNEYNNNMDVEEFIVDSSSVNGYKNPQIISIDKNSGTIRNNIQLYAGSMVLQGTCIAVVNRIGQETLLASLIQKGKWPPTQRSMVGDDGNYELVEQTEII